ETGHRSGDDYTAARPGSGCPPRVLRRSQLHLHFFNRSDLIGRHLQRNASENLFNWLKTCACAPCRLQRALQPQPWRRPSCRSLQKGDVGIRYEETGSGFPLLVTPGGGLNSRVSNWPTAVINAMEEFKNDFRCITMDQRNANGGESTGPVQVDNPWDAF